MDIRGIFKIMQVRWAPSLGALESTHEIAWGTEDYKDRNKPTCFFGLYDLRDYIALWRHKGKAFVLWAGSDILNLKSGFLFNDGKLKSLSKLLRGNWWVYPILKKAEHWVENLTEERVLESLGIKVSGVCQSFLGNINKFKIQYKYKKIANVYLSANEGRQEEYGFGTIERIAKELPFIKFHLYGASWKTKNKNVIVHGWISKEQMNKEIEGYQIGLRLNNFDGFSEILAKAVLMGQYAISKVKHPLIPSFENDMELILILNNLRKNKEPNYKAHDWYIYNLNRFPWNERLI